MQTVSPGDCCCSNTITTTTATDTSFYIPTNLYPYDLTTTTNAYESIVNSIINNTTKEKKETMPATFNFGPIKDDSVRLTTNGIAVKNAANEYVTYNPKTDAIESVVFSVKSSYIYTIPVAMKDVMISDIIVHQKHYCYVLDGNETCLEVIDLTDNERRTIYPSKSPFGFNFITKVTSLININADKDNPCGDMMFYAMMQEDNKDLLPFLLLKDKTIDPMMLLLLNNKDNMNLLPFLFYMKNEKA